MKTIWSFFFFAACQFCIAAGDSNIIAVSEWSQPVSLRNEQLHDEAIRGRLLIIQGMEPAYGGSPTTNRAMTFVELQNVTRACCDDIHIYFAVTNLRCELSDATGKVVPKPTDGPWSGRGPFLPCWVTLPYNSTIRLFVNGGTMNPLEVYPSGEPWCFWSIPVNDTNVYYLAGTLSISTHTNSILPPDYFNATLVLPKTRISLGSPEKLKRKRSYALEADLFATNSITIAKENAGFVLAYTSDTIHLGRQQLVVRVWDTFYKSWPGSQPQVIQVVTTNGIVLSAKKVGDEPMMLDAWTVSDGNGGLFVYIKCRHRHRMAAGVYIYRIDDAFEITDQGIYFDKQDIENEQKVKQEMLDRFTRQHMEGPNKASEATNYVQRLKERRDEMLAQKAKGVGLVNFGRTNEADKSLQTDGVIEPRPEH